MPFARKKTRSTLHVMNVLAVQELQDLIFSHLEVEDLLKLQRVSKFLKARIKTENDTLLQVKLYQQRSEANVFQLRWNPLLRIDLFLASTTEYRTIQDIGRDIWAALKGSGPLLFPLTKKESRERNMIFQGTNVAFRLSPPNGFSGMTRYNRHTGVRSFEALLTVEVFLRDPISSAIRVPLPWNNVLETDFIGHLDSRLDMLMFPTLLPHTLNIKILVYQPDKRLFWQFEIICQSGEEPVRPMKEKESIQYTSRHDTHKRITEWLPSREATGGLTAREIPINGTLREMLAVLEGYVLAEVPGFEGWSAMSQF